MAFGGLQDSLTLAKLVVLQPVDPVSVSVELVEAQVIQNITDQGEENSDADGQPKDVDRSEELVLQQVSDGSAKEVFEHVRDSGFNDTIYKEVFVDTKAHFSRNSSIGRRMLVYSKPFGHTTP